MATATTNDNLALPEIVAEVWNRYQWLIPIDGDSKKPAFFIQEWPKSPPDEDTLRIWRGIGVPRWGLLTGAGSGVVVLDADVRDGKRGLEVMKAWGFGKAHVKTASGGAHFYFRHPGRRIMTRANIADGVDVRGDGGLVVFHGDGYQFVGDPLELYDWDDLPEDVRALLESDSTATDFRINTRGLDVPDELRGYDFKPINGTARLVDEYLQYTRDGDSRNRVGFNLALALLRKDHRPDDVFNLLQEKYLPRVPKKNEPYTARELRKSIESAWRIRANELLEGEGMNGTHNAAGDSGADSRSEQQSAEENIVGQMAELLGKLTPDQLNEVVNATKKKRMPLSTDKTAALICDRYHFAKDKAGTIFVYRNGVYVQDQFAIGQALTEVLSAEKRLSEWTSAKKKNVEDYIATHAPFLASDPYPIINLQNGVIHLDNLDELKPHNPELRTTTQIPIAFDPAAKCPAWDRFFSWLIPGKEQDAWALFGICAAGSVSFQRAVFLEGPGGGGKGTFLKALTSFVGRDNAAEIPLRDLERQFTKVELFGKLVNCCGDITGDFNDTQDFKMITGGDRLRGERKGKDAFLFEPFCKTIYSCNKMPRTKRDVSEGFFQRIVVIKFERIIRGTADDRQQNAVLAELAAELPGALNKALAALARLRENGYRIEWSAGVQQATAGYRRDNDQALTWLQDNLDLEDSEGTIPTKEVLQRLNDFLINEAGRAKGITPQALGHLMKNFGKVQNERDPGPGRQRLYKGVRWRSDLPDLP